MKFLNKLVLICIVGFGITACSDFGDINVDPKSPSSADPAFLFTNAAKSYSDWTTDSDSNTNVGRLAAQYFSQVTYTNESRYDWTGRSVGRNIWSEIYATMTDLGEARRIINATEIDKVALGNKNACITTLEVLAYQVLVDLFGNIPYSEALDAANNPSPAYDDAATIYMDLISRIDSAINDLDASSGAFGSADPIFDGDVAAWKKFASSVKLRLGIRLVDTNPGLAQQTIESAAADAMTSNADNAMFGYLEGSVNGNPLYSTLVLSGRHDYVPSNTLVDYMNAVKDPRRSSYMTLDLATATSYVGNIYGQTASVQFGDYSQINPMMENPTFPGQLMTYTEVGFILAEAAERGWSVGGSAAEWYNMAVTASIMQWGGSMAVADAYLTSNGVAYGIAEGGSNMNAIAMQKWLALYNDGYQGWIEWRRLDYPILNVPVDLTMADIPVRHAYPVSEASVNGTNYAIAANAMGGDSQATKVFWDVK